MRHNQIKQKLSNLVYHSILIGAPQSNLAIICKSITSILNTYFAGHFQIQLADDITFQIYMSAQHMIKLVILKYYTTVLW